MSLVDRLMESPLVYQTWQRPFADRKLAPLLRHNDLSDARRVLDVGCGPGTNARYFAGADYLGIDLNPEYIRAARERYPGRFEVGDATALQVPDGHFDFVLANSLYHHIDDEGTHRALDCLARAVTPDGTVHILDLALPRRPGPARLLARLDRGDFARPLEVWREMFARHFRVELFEPYPLGVPGVPLWHMVYMRGRPLV